MGTMGVDADAAIGFKLVSLESVRSPAVLVSGEVLLSPVAVEKSAAGRAVGSTESKFVAVPGSRSVSEKNARNFPTRRVVG